MEWLDKPAIRWSAEITRSSEDTACPYWETTLIGLLSELGDRNSDERNKTCSISYGSLIVAAISLVHSLRQRLTEMVLQANVCIPSETNKVGMCVVVAIPEGPLLPIAILVVHLLNEPLRVESTTCWDSPTPFAVLVPLEPTEGKERLFHMLVDVRPTMILCSSQMDLDRIADILASVEPGETSVTADGLLQSAQPELVDFGVLLCETIQSISSNDFDNLGQRIRDLLYRHNEHQGLLQVISCCERYLFCKTEETDNRLYASDNRISHIVFTSGTTGRPKGCISSIQSLGHYLHVKNGAHGITFESIVLLASALSFDPCLSDILATFHAQATLVIAPRTALIQNLSTVLKQSNVTHVLCTPTLWGMLHSAGARPNDFPSLQVVALGGEVIPKHINKVWARDWGESCASRLRLCATYGVTEACVYQTFGEVFRDYDECRGQNVGKPLPGLAVRIRREDTDDGHDSHNVESFESSSELGEIVLYGKQIDGYSGYLNRTQLTREKFIKVPMKDSDNDVANEQECYCYLTGDRGYIDLLTNDVHIVGRIQGEDGMVKVNGVRVELGEIESALIDDSFVTACLAVDRQIGNGSKQIHAFCILSRQGLEEVGLHGVVESHSGILLTTGPLLLLLRSRCTERVRAGVVPSNFAIIKGLPLSPTGKCDRRQLPQLSECVSLESLLDISESRSTLLREYGASGPTVADKVIECMNLQPCQQSHLTTNMNFGMLGGDSLAATRVARALYAHHKGVSDSRNLGGQYGVLEGPFATIHLLRARSLGEYVDWLDSHGVCDPTRGANRNGKEMANGETSVVKNGSAFDNYDRENEVSFQLYDALLEAATSGHSLIACALLDEGADPNFGQHGGRLGKTTDRRVRKQMFCSNPLHLACSRGDPMLVKKLLGKGCKFNSPDAAGSFPIHLAASSISSSHDNTDKSTQECTAEVTTTEDKTAEHKDEDERRYECVRALLDAGAPLTMKDGNKQTVLHSAARAGHCKLLHYLMKCWSNIDNSKKDSPKVNTVPFDWRDRWCRTPVHWAVLNGKVEALKILLDGGCQANPPKPKSNRRTSVAIESPLEICNRLYRDPENAIGRQIRALLLYTGGDEGKRESAILLQVTR